MQPAETRKVGYVVKRYPRYSETFIVNEILAHESTGLEIEIFALHPPVDTHFQEAIARVRASVHYLQHPVKPIDLWREMEQASMVVPGFSSLPAAARGVDVRTVHHALQLARMVRQKGVTHLHAHFATSATTVARLGARLAGLPFTFTAHAKDIFHESVEADDLRDKMRDAAAVITVSDYNLAYLKERFGVAAARVHRIYNGLERRRFPYREPSDRPSKIVSVGRLVEKKGFEDLIDACVILARQEVPFTCEIIGSGMLEADLRARVERLGLLDRVQLLGPRPQQDVIRHVQEAAVFAAPCVVGEDGNRDGLPTVLLEAMALGTPCVSTDVTGIPEVLRHEETGLMVPQHDPAALADALKRLLEDAALRVRLARRAVALIEAEFDIHRNTARIRSLFETCRWHGDGDALPVYGPAMGEVA